MLFPSTRSNSTRTSSPRGPRSLMNRGEDFFVILEVMIDVTEEGHVRSFPSGSWILAFPGSLQPGVALASWLRRRCNPENLSKRRPHRLSATTYHLGGPGKEAVPGIDMGEITVIPGFRSRTSAISRRLTNFTIVQLETFDDLDSPLLKLGVEFEGRPSWSGFWTARDPLSSEFLHPTPAISNHELAQGGRHRLLYPSQHILEAPHHSIRVSSPSRPGTRSS